MRTSACTDISPLACTVVKQNGGAAVCGELLADRDALLRDLGIKAKYLAVGVERLDYTKGILEVKLT